MPIRGLRLPPGPLITSTRARRLAMALRLRSMSLAARLRCQARDTEARSFTLRLTIATNSYRNTSKCRCWLRSRRASFIALLSCQRGRIVMGWGNRRNRRLFLAGPVISNASSRLHLRSASREPSIISSPSTSSWMLVQGTFRCSGRRGPPDNRNFLPTPPPQPTPSGGPISSYGYYYFDDVSVEAVCGPRHDEQGHLRAAPLWFLIRQPDLICAVDQRNGHHRQHRVQQFVSRWLPRERGR